MKKKTEQSPADRDAEARREFLKQMGKGTATVPALSLLLAANFRTTRATPQTGGGCGCGGGSILTDN